MDGAAVDRTMTPQLSGSKISWSTRGPVRRGRWTAPAAEASAQPTFPSVVPFTSKQLNSPVGALDGPFSEIFSTVDRCKYNAHSIKCSNVFMDDDISRSAGIMPLMAYCGQVSKITVRYLVLNPLISVAENQY